MANTIVIAPHPDDETLALGGLIAQIRANDGSVQVVAVTDGENAYAQSSGLAEIRQREQTDALNCLGVMERDILRLKLPDSDVVSCEPALERSILSLVFGATPGTTHIIAPWPYDFHPDHEACGRAAQRAAMHTGAKLTFYFFWTWHRGTPELLRGESIQRFSLSAKLQKIKLQALAHHVSQLTHSSGDPILADSLLWPARMPFEIFLSA